jgi:hypothetical protein
MKRLLTRKTLALAAILALGIGSVSVAFAENQKGEGITGAPGNGPVEHTSAGNQGGEHSGVGNANCGPRSC